MGIISMVLFVLGIVTFVVYCHSSPRSNEENTCLGVGIVFTFIVEVLSILALAIYTYYNVGDYYDFMKHSEVTKTVEVNNETTEMYISVDGKEYHFVFNEEDKK